MTTMIMLLQKLFFLTIIKSDNDLKEIETQKCEAFVFQEELLTDLEAQLEDDDDQGMSKLTIQVQFVQFLRFILSCQEQ